MEKNELEKTEPFQYFEKLDDQAIADELQGVWVRSLVYQFNQRGQVVTGLSVKGVQEAARFMVKHGYNIECEHASIDKETEKEFRASCKVTYTAPNGMKLVEWGYSRASKFYASKAPNEFAYVQALSKAQRNALRTCIPEKLMAELVQKYIDEGKVQKIPNTTKSVGPTQQAELRETV